MFLRDVGANLYGLFASKQKKLQLQNSEYNLSSESDASKLPAEVWALTFAMLDKTSLQQVKLSCGHFNQIVKKLKLLEQADSASRVALDYNAEPSMISFQSKGRIGAFAIFPDETMVRTFFYPWINDNKIHISHMREDHHRSDLILQPHSSTPILPLIQDLKVIPNKEGGYDLLVVAAFEISIWDYHKGICKRKLNCDDIFPIDDLVVAGTKLVMTKRTTSGCLFSNVIHVYDSLSGESLSSVRLPSLIDKLAVLSDDYVAAYSYQNQNYLQYYKININTGEYESVQGHTLKLHANQDQYLPGGNFVLNHGPQAIAIYDGKTCTRIKEISVVDKNEIIEAIHVLPNGQILCVSNAFKDDKYTYTNHIHMLRFPELTLENERRSQKRM